MDTNDVLRQMAESGRNMRFGRGVIGKSANIWMGILALWLVILFRLSDGAASWFLIGGGVFITLVAFVGMREMRGFAERNPGLALLEGSQLLEYERFVAASKSLPAGERTKAVAGPISEDVTPALMSGDVPLGVEPATPVAERDGWDQR